MISDNAPIAWEILDESGSLLTLTVDHRTEDDLRATSRVQVELADDGFHVFAVDGSALSETAASELVDDLEVYFFPGVRLHRTRTLYRKVAS